MIGLDIDVVLCTELGLLAFQQLRKAGVDVYVGAEGTVRTALEAHREGKLVLATEATCHPGHHRQNQKYRRKRA